MTMNSILDNLAKMKESLFQLGCLTREVAKRNQNNDCKDKLEQELMTTKQCKLKTGTDVEGRNKDKHGWW